MKRLMAIMLCCMAFTGCGNKPSIEITQFHNELNAFCDNIQKIDSAINEISNITADEEGLEVATTELMIQLDSLEDEFIKFANMDFPAEYDYLENMADESGSYMSEAVKAYRKAYEEKYSVGMEDYAQQNYSRAYKRVQFIIDVVNGKDPNASNNSENTDQ